MKFGLKHLLMMSTLAGVLAPVAVAQDNPFGRGRHTAVTERSQPEFDPEVIRAGAFQIIADMLASAEYNDNVFAQSANQQSDTILRVQPSVVVRSDWSVHNLTAGVNLDHRQYATQDTETTTDYNAFVSGRLDGTRTFQLNGYANAGQTTEPRYEPAGSNPGAPEPAQNDYAGAIVGASFRSDRLLFAGQVGVRENNYQSFYSYRDVTETSVSGRASYAVSPDFAVFVQGRQTVSEYDQSIPSRDGTQTSIQAGASFEFVAPFRGEISVGQVEDDKDDPAANDVTGLSLDASVLWFPTQLTTVTFSGNTGISDPGIPQATSAKYNRYSVRADHELLRNVLLYGQVGYGTYDYGSTPTFQREDEYVSVGAGAAYKLNKHAHVEFGYSMYSWDTSGTDARSFDQNVLSVGLRVFP